VNDRNLCESSALGCSDYKSLSVYGPTPFDHGDPITRDTITTRTETQSMEAGTIDHLSYSSDSDPRIDSNGRVKRDRYWNYDIGPLVFFDFDFGKKYVSLNSYYPATSAFSISERGEVLKSLSSITRPVELRGAINQESSKLYPTLVVAPQEGAFRAEISNGLALGIGALATFKQVNATGPFETLSPYVGMAPLVGKTSVSERTVIGRDSLKHLKGLKLPADKRELANWKNLDKLSYSSTGGLLFIGGVSLYGFNVGTTYVATGSWSTEIQKIGEDKAYVKISSTKLQSLGLCTSAEVVSLSVAKFKSIEDSFSFFFDLSDPVAEAAFGELLKGHAQAAQKLADNADSLSVVRIESSSGVSEGRLKNFGVGIPFINWNSTKAKITSVEANDFHPIGSHLDASYGVYLRDKDTRILGYSSSYTYGFYGAQYDNRARDGVIEQGLFGQIGWSYHTSQADESKLERAIRKLVDLTGMQNELYVIVRKFKGNIGYASVEFSMRFDAWATHLLMGLANDPASVQNLRRISDAFVDSFFAVAPHEGVFTAEEFCGSKVDESCVRKYKNESQDAIDDMVKALGDMNSSYGHDRKTFVRAYANFGKAMLTNAFTFQTIYNLVKGRGVTAHYSITGEQLPAYDLSFDWKRERDSSSLAR
jgi:hypothetical protein